MAGEFRCRACGAEFDNKNQLEAHSRSSHPSMSQDEGPDQGTPSGSAR